LVSGADNGRALRQFGPPVRYRERSPAQKAIGDQSQQPLHVSVV